MDTKELITNKELVNDIAESLEDFTQGSEAKYDLWVVGRDCKNVAVAELFIYEFDAHKDAVAKAETVDITFVEEQTDMTITDYCGTNNIDHFSVEIETVITDPEDDDSTMNIGTIYKRDLWLDGEYGSEEELGFDGEPIIALESRDYEILDDNTIKIRAELLHGFNENNSVHIYFADNKDSDILTCKIVSCEDSYFYCELSI